MVAQDNGGIRFMKVLLSSLILFVAGCAHVQPAEVVLPMFPAPAPGVQTVNLTALASGTLIEKNGCIRLARDASHSAMILWSHDFELVKLGASNAIRYKPGRMAFEVGSRVKAGGGAIETPPSNLLNLDVAMRCGGPYISVHTMSEA